jgi:hypothetical protein
VDTVPAPLSSSSTVMIDSGEVENTSKRPVQAPSRARPVSVWSREERIGGLAGTRACSDLAVVGGQALDQIWGERDEARLPELADQDSEDAVVEIDILFSEPQNLAAS